jgi:hypothetical protein
VIVMASFTSTDRSAGRAVRRAGVISMLIVALTLVTPQAALALAGADAGTAITAAPNGYGYAIISAAGGQYNYGASKFSGSLAGSPLAAPVIDAASVPGSDAIWMAGADGGVFALGGAPFHGSLSGRPLSQPVTAIVASPSGNGYLLVARDGGTFAFGDYPFPGSLAGTPLNAPIVDAAAAPGGGVWLVAADGGVFALGGAPFHGSLGGRPLSQPVTAIVASPSGNGYLLVARDGGTFAFGDYRFPGSLAGIALNAPVVDAIGAAGGGLWIVGEDGGVFALSAPFYGSATGHGNSVRPPPAGSPANGSNGGMVAVACAARGSITVAAQIAPSVARLLAAANDAGLRLCGSGARSVKRQEELRAAHCGGRGNVYNDRARCRPPTAVPGRSMHEKGLAIDFENCKSRSTRCFKWLTQNAARYGLSNLKSEPWHWSTNGR